MTDNKKRQETVDFVDYFNAGTSILVKKGNPETSTIWSCSAPIITGSFTTTAGTSPSVPMATPGSSPRNGSTPTDNPGRLTTGTPHPTTAA